MGGLLEMRSPSAVMTDQVCVGGVKADGRREQVKPLDISNFIVLSSRQFGFRFSLNAANPSTEFSPFISFS